MKVLLGWHANEAERAQAQAALPETVTLDALHWDEDVPFPYGADRQEYRDKIADADAVLTWVLPEEILKEATNVKYVSWMHSGCDRLPLELMAQRGITLSNIPNAHQPAVAEQAWALLLASLKRIPQKQADHQAGIHVPYWRPSGVNQVLLGGTLLVLGAGQIGARVAQVGQAFGMRTVGFRQRVDQPVVGFDELVDEAGLRRVLPEADALVIAIPSTTHTRGMVDADFLSSLPDHAHVINVARGDIVDEVAMYRALTSGTIAGFGSDVWWDYEDAMPPDQHFGSPSRLGVHLLPQVIVSGDQGSNTDFSRLSMLEAGLANIRAFATNEAPPHVVDLKAGY